MPEKVLQFGTGVLLRGLPDYFIDKANRQGIFNGRVVVVKSTSQGDASGFDKQDGLYTLCIRGLENGQSIKENIINASISRVLTATEHWDQILACAHNPEMEIIISNTTEVGIQLVKDDIRLHPPKSFPGKLLAFLYERFKAFGGNSESGMVVVPTELIPQNGTRLEAIVYELAHLNGLEEEFIDWLESSNHFCNSLVDRIVPGKPDQGVQDAIESELGYTDALLTMSEVYRLWAIEGDEKVKRILSFAHADEGVVIQPNIEMHRELKLRLLNGTHTLSCGIAILAGCETVKEAMDDELVSGFIASVMQHEIAPAIPYNIDLGTAREFGNRVLDRFRNPHIKHNWINITMQYSSKMKMRCIPVLSNHYLKFGTVPDLFALGFAGYIYFMKALVKENNQYYGKLNGEQYPINDDQAPLFFKRWSELPLVTVGEEVLRDSTFWGAELHTLPGFQQAVTEYLNLLDNKGARETLRLTQAKKEIVA